MSFLGEVERDRDTSPNNGDTGGLLRVSTAGSVDDGKSTLIGRLLHDSRQILEDQLFAIKRASNRRGVENIDLSLLTDGLEAEREQGITIDVAYRFFSTPRRKFILADTPGHEQYTRNMATGASTADAAIVLADVTKGLLVQSKRHLYIAQLLGIRHVIVAVNKMDLAGFDESAFLAVRNAFERFAEKLPGPHLQLHFVPLSALFGDMIVERGERLGWYSGPTLLEWLESIETTERSARLPFRFPVQIVQKSGEHGRTYMGSVASGSVSVGQPVVVLPAGRKTTINGIYQWPCKQPAAYSGDAVAISIADEIDISRGDQIASVDKPPHVSRSLQATLIWFAAEPLALNGRYLLKHTSRTVKACITSVTDIVDVGTLEKRAASGSIAVNDIAHVTLVLTQPIFFDPYVENRATGAFILIDETSDQTVAAGMIT